MSQMTWTFWRVGYSKPFTCGCGCIKNQILKTIYSGNGFMWKQIIGRFMVRMRSDIK